jgi:Ricin-type beta-trefoil lectin domain
MRSGIQTGFSMFARSLVILSAAVVVLMAAPQRVAAQNGALLTYANNCVLPYEGLGYQRVAVRVNTCTQSGARYTISNGVVRTSDGLCMDHGVSYSMTPDATNDGVVFVPCHGGKSQSWYFIKNGLAQNAANPKVCLDIEGGYDKVATRLIVWPCDYRNATQTDDCARYGSSCPRTNQRFFIGTGNVSTYTLSTAGLPSAALTKLSQGLGVTFDTGMRIVAGGGGNIVAAGGGNIVAAGGGNIVAGGGGNIVATDGATFKTVINLLGQDGTSLRSSILSGGSFR